ncbi:hypothetical protein QJS10_CPB20g01378 [Acorus calamus]|uniref:Uncharacterized protein n=1 Tax=Acorus calamus TaxID=4465 RepID=A0AAV9C9L1_ACOCL|nr:hypothetical protein QJS10_CPB20g01378 [Acorus calamus]
MRLRRPPETIGEHPRIPRIRSSTPPLLRPSTSATTYTVTLRPASLSHHNPLHHPLRRPPATPSAATTCCGQQPLLSLMVGTGLLLASFMTCFRASCDSSFYERSGRVISQELEIYV